MDQIMSPNFHSLEFYISLHLEEKALQHFSKNLRFCMHIGIRSKKEDSMTV